jgi:hypothetical protein
LRVWYVFGGAVCILTAVAVLFIPAIEKIEQNRLPTSEKVNARPLVVSASVGA